MRGTHNNVISVRLQGFNLLNDMYARGKGRSKHADKKKPNGTDPYIYTSTTLDTYSDAWKDFCETMKADQFKVNGHSPRTLEEAAEFADRYLQMLKSRKGYLGRDHLSPSTIKTKFSGIAKVLGLNAADYDLPTRYAADTLRSRTEVVGDKHFSLKNNADLILFAQTTGLRNAKELQAIRGTDLLRRDDGRYAIHVKGKGGRIRDAGLYGSQEEIDRVVEIMKNAGDSIVWPKVHSNADIQSYRADYAQRVYTFFARDPYTLPFSQRYCCRSEKRGIWYDRDALLSASFELGHSRPSVMARDYLYKMPDPRLVPSDPAAVKNVAEE